ncbi:class I lanthipeptide [Hymenobacter persicinus]|uniref:RSAM-modified peptide n=1 Tax=Hymenobacter persicinus TaxID=2025506 RepID=A0A4Q5L864_9BACT|nr:class I lanthipeptide [Hymenobacter persicinus]RYU73091.1 rSAM-modified peptide [Hymenobacter persicinus]
MKKVTTKLALNKQTLASLDQKQMAAAKGGFTYSLSLGVRCNYSDDHTHNSPGCYAANQ